MNYKYITGLIAVISSLTLITGCSTTDNDVAISTATPANEQCQRGNISIRKDFAAGRFSGCRWISDSLVELTLEPEDKPINASPWYAFKIQSKNRVKLTVKLNYSHHKHRYWPKVSADRLNWQRMKKEHIQLNENKTRISLKFDLSDEDLWVSAQPIIDNQDYQRWLAGYNKKSDAIKVKVIGLSTEKRPLYQLSSLTGDSSPVIVLLGRQHPPEVTGAVAMKAFVDQLFSNSPLAVKFRKNFNILAYPNINPDGVAAGNWRHNMRGKDLNRDWGPFSQVETQQVIAAIDKQIEDKTVWGMLDFHSTWDDIFYTQSDTQLSRFPKFTAAWLANINSARRAIDFTRKPGHNSQSPTSKTYFYERFNIPAITFELGDNSKVADINNVSVLAAETYMKQLLARKQS